MLVILLYIHLIFAFFSLGLLLLRGGMNLRGADWRQYKLLKILPHLSDTLLLSSGVALWIYFSIGIQTWLVVKMLCLVGYIVFTTKAFSRHAKSFNFMVWLLANVCLILAIGLGYIH